MLVSLFALMSAYAFAAPIEITITEANVTRLELTCGAQVRQIAVSNGKATIPDLPGKCSVSLVRPSGVIDGPGKYSCGFEACTLAEIDHKPVSDGPGKVNIILAPGVSPSGIEMTCPSGYRTRAAIERNTALFSQVPNEACTIMLKGGPPLRYTGIGWGTYNCQASGSTLICSKR